MQYAQTMFGANAAPAAAANPELMMVTGGLSAFGTYYSSLIKQQGLNTEADIATLEAQQAQTQGKEQANVVRQRLLETLAQNRAAAGHGGVSSKVGSPANAQIVSSANAGLDIATIKGDANIKATSLKLRAQRLRAEGKAALLGGIFEAGGGLLGDAYKAKARGTVPTPKTVTT